LLILIGECFDFRVANFGITSLAIIEISLYFIYYKAFWQFLILNIQKY